MFIVIETHGGSQYAIICIDEQGENMLFSTEPEAQNFADEECQDGIIVEVA